MAHGSGVISSPTGGRATGRQREQRNRAAQRRGEAERGSGEGKRRGEAEPACSPARRMRRNGEGRRKRRALRSGGCGTTGAAQRGRCNEGRATGATRRKLPMKTTQRTGRFAPSGFFWRRFAVQFKNFAPRMPRIRTDFLILHTATRIPESNQNDIPVL